MEFVSPPYHSFLGSDVLSQNQAFPGHPSLKHSPPPPPQQLLALIMLYGISDTLGQTKFGLRMPLRMERLGNEQPNWMERHWAFAFITKSWVSASCSKWASVCHRQSRQRPSCDHFGCNSLVSSFPLAVTITCTGQGGWQHSDPFPVQTATWF